MIQADVNFPRLPAEKNTPMSQAPSQCADPLDLSEKEMKYHATQLLVWLWQNLNDDPWACKLACGKVLTDVTLRMVPLNTETNVIRNWAMIIAMMLNGTEHIYGAPDPFNMERGKSPEAQAWRLLIINSLAFLPDEAYVVSTVSRIALSTIDLPFELKLGAGKSVQAYGYDIVHYLNHEGQGNSIAWFRQLDMLQYRAGLLERLPAVLDVWQRSFASFAARMPKSSAFAARLTRQSYALQTLVKQAPDMIAPALQDIAALLRPIQNLILPGADKELGELAATPYQLKKMVRNPAYSAQVTRADIDRILASFFTGGEQPEREAMA